jgi:hypothetical protein
MHFFFIVLGILDIHSVSKTGSVFVIRCKEGGGLSYLGNRKPLTTQENVKIRLEESQQTLRT